MKYHKGYQTKIHPFNKLTHKVFKDVFAFNYTRITMSKGTDKDDKDLVVTLLSNGSSNLFRNNSLTSFSNKLHTPIILDPLNYNYIALQEIGISLNSSNIRIPYEKPAIIYFEWDTTFRHHLQDLSDYETRKQVFIDTYEKTKIISLLTTLINLEFIQTKDLLKIKSIPQTP